MHKISVTEITGEGWPCPHCMKILRGQTISHLNNHIKTIHEGKALCFVENKGKAKRQQKTPDAPDPKAPVVCTFDFPQMGAKQEATGPFRDYPVTFVTREIPGRKYLAGPTTSTEDSAILRAISGELSVTCEQAFEMYMKSWTTIEISFDPSNKKAVSVLAEILTGRADGSAEVHDHSLGVYIHCNGRLIMTTDRGKSVFIPVPANGQGEAAFDAEEVLDSVVFVDEDSDEVLESVGSIDEDSDEDSDEVLVSVGSIEDSDEDSADPPKQKYDSDDSLESLESLLLRRKRARVMLSSDDDEEEAVKGRKRGGKLVSRGSSVFVDDEEDSVTGVECVSRETSDEMTGVNATSLHETNPTAQAAQQHSVMGEVELVTSIDGTPGGKDFSIGGMSSAQNPPLSEAKVADIKVPTSAMVNPSAVPFLFKRGMAVEKSVDQVIMGTSAEYVLAFLNYLKPLGLLRFALNAVENKETTVSKKCFELLANQLRGAKKTRRMTLDQKFSTEFIRSLQLVPPKSRKKKFTTLQIFTSLSQNCDFDKGVSDEVLTMAEFLVPLLEIPAISDGAEYPMTWMQSYLYDKANMRVLRDVQVKSPLYAPVKKGLLKKHPRGYPAFSHIFPDVKCPPKKPYFSYLASEESLAEGRQAYEVKLVNFTILDQKEYDIAQQEWKRSQQIWNEEYRQYRDEMEKFGRRQKYISFAQDVWDYFTYRITWTVSPGTYATLHGIFQYAYQRLVAAAKEKKVLQESVTIKIKGESSEISLQSRQWPWLKHDTSSKEDEVNSSGEGESVNDADETGSCRTRLRITIDDGSVVDAVVPFMKLVLHNGKLEIFLRNSLRADGRNILSKRPSLVIARDGSAAGTDRAKAIVSFLSAWNSQPAAVSKTLGDLMG